MSNNKDSVLHQVRLIQAQVFAAIEEANAGVPTERRVTPGSALTAVKRSLSATRNLPFEVREFQAMRELSAFINLVQKNTFSDTFANHTDLLPISHPASTRVHGLTASALVEARLRWILSDTRISEQARPLLASIFTASSDSVEYKYAMTRLTTLPSGSYPLEALVAAFGDGNSYLARRARAMLQRRDRKGRFAFQGGGMSALVERANGQVQRLTGRVVSQSEDGNNVRIQLPNGRLVDVPVDGGEFIKAVLGKNKDGFSGVEAKHKVGDLIINEEDLQFFDAPHGFRKDTSYTGPGVKFTDDEYDVVKNGKDFAIARRENGQSLGNVDNWADAQKMIYDDEPVADAEAGREPIARLDQDQIDRMYDPNFDPKEILTPEGADLGKGSEADVSAIPGEFEYNYPDGAYQLPQDVKHVSGFNDPVNGSSDFTDDPAELAQKFETNALVNALREALIPDQASKANGEGNLKFDKKEPVPAEAIYLALQEKGVNAKQEVAKIYDAANGDKKNQEALARLEPKPVKVSKPESVAEPTEVPSEPSTPSALEEQPTQPPAAAMRKGQVSPGGDWKWYPPVRMGGNQQLQGHWGLTEKGVAKLPPKEVKTPPVASEPVLPDEIGGGWEPTIDAQGGKNAPMYKKTIDGSNFIFRQEEGGWIPLRVVNGERRLLSNYDNEDILQNADADDFENKVAFIQDNMQKAYRQSLETDLKINNFDKKVVDLVQDGKADEIIAAIKADPVYKELEDKYQDYLNDAGGRPGVMKAVVALGKINENLDQIRDFNNPATPTDEPDVADLVDEVKGGIPTSSEIQAMLDGEGIGSDDNISGDAPSEVLPKALQEEKAVNIPDDIQKAINELDAMEKAIKDALDELPLFQGEQNRVISALLAVNLAQDAKNKAIANLENRMPFVDAMDAAIWQIGSAVESLTADEIKIVELLELKDSLKKLQQQFADAKFKHLESIPKDKTPIDDVIENMLLGGEPEVAVEDLIARVIPIEEEAPEAAAPPGGGGPPGSDPAAGGPPGSGPGSGSGPSSGPTPGPEPTPPASRGRRVRNNNVAANRRWQARFGIKPPVFYKKNRGMFYDINGVPVNVGDRVVHNNPDKNEKYGEGVIISRIPNLGRWRLGRGGEQVKVDYASYVWVQFANGKKAKLATRMLINKNPDAVENPANEVKPMRDAEMPPPDVFIDDWKKFGKALAEFGVEPGKDARGNDGFQADAGNAQQMVISKDADGNYAVYLKEENIWRNRQVEPLFVTKNLPEAANYFIAEVHNRRYGTDFPPNPVWMGEKAPSAVPNPETNVVDVPEASAVSNAGLPNVVNIDTNGKFEDLQKQIQDAIDNGQQIAFNYKGEDRLVTPKRIWTNPKNGNINLDAVGEDGFKVYTIVNMENAENPIEATPIPEPTPIPEDVAPLAEDKPSTPLEDQMASVRAEFMRVGELLADKAAEGIGPSDPEFAELEERRAKLIILMRNVAEQIKRRDAAPSKDPMVRLYELKEEYKNLNEELLDLELAPSPDSKAIAEKQNRQRELLEQMKPLRAEVNKDVVSVADEPKEEEDKFKDFKEYVDGLVNESEFQKDYDFNDLGGDGILRVQDRNNKNQANIEWDEDAQGYRVNFRPRDLGREEVFADIQEAGQYAMDNLDKNRNKPEPKLPKSNSGWKAEAVDAINELFPVDIEENVLFSDNGLPEFHGGDDRNNYNDIIIELPFRGPNNYYQVVGIKQPDGKYRIFQVQYEDLGNSRWQANVIEQYLPVDNNIDLVDRMVDAYRMLEAEVNDGEDLNDFFKNDDGYYDPEGNFYQRVGGVLNKNPLAEKPAELVNFGIPEKEETAAPEAGEVPASAPSAFVGLGDALYINDPRNAEKHLRNAITDKRNVVFRYKGTDRALIPLSIWTNPKNGNVNLYAEDENGDRKNYTISKIEKVERPAAAKPAVAEEVAKAPSAQTEVPTERAVPIPRIDVPEPAPVNPDEAKLLKEIAAAKKDLANLKRQIGPQNRARDYRQKRFIQYVQYAHRELGKGNVSLAKTYFEAALQRLNNGIAAYDANTYEDYKARMEKMAVIFGEDAPGAVNPEIPLNGAPIQEVDPAKIAQERIAAGKNVAPKLDDFWKAELLDNQKLDELAQQGLDIRQHKDELQKFFGADAQPMAALSEGARFALQAMLQRKIVNPNKSTAEKNNIKNIIQLVNAVNAERLAYEPNDGSKLDARGALLLEFSPNDMKNAIGNGGRLTKNGQDLGFKVKKTGKGGGRRSTNVTYRVVDEKTGKVYYYKLDTEKENVDSELAALELARALGMHGVYPAERHPTRDNVIIMGAAGQNLKLKEAPVEYGNAAPDYSDIVDYSPINQVFQFVVLDAVMHNNDRHGHNWFVARPQNGGEKLNDIRFMPLIFDNGLGQIIDPQEARYGQRELDPIEFIMERNAANRNRDVAKKLVQRMGPKAFYEMMQISTQQALQALRRMYPAGSNPDIDKLIARLEELKDADISSWGG